MSWILGHPYMFKTVMIKFNLCKINYRQTPRVWILNENKPGSALCRSKKAWDRRSKAFLRLQRHVLVYFHSDSRREGVWHLYPAHFTTLSLINVKFNGFGPKVHPLFTISTSNHLYSKYRLNGTYLTRWNESINA